MQISKWITHEYLKCCLGKSREVRGQDRDKILGRELRARCWG